MNTQHSKLTEFVILLGGSCKNVVCIQTTGWKSRPSHLCPLELKNQNLLQNSKINEPKPDTSNKSISQGLHCYPVPQADFPSGCSFRDPAPGPPSCPPRRSGRCGTSAAASIGAPGAGPRASSTHPKPPKIQFKNGFDLKKLRKTKRTIV